MSETYDAIVIGAGAMGSAAAYYLSQRGQSVLLLEQFELDHRMGSSYGYSRIIRYSYDHAEYVDLMRDTFPLWFALQDTLGETLYVQTGGIDFGPADDTTLQATIAAVRNSGIDHDLLTPKAAAERFPQFSFDRDFQVLYQPDSGFIQASKAVMGHIKLARANGAVIKDKVAVRDIELGAGSVDITTTTGAYAAGRLILTAGAWARSLLRQTGIDLPLVPLRCQLNFMAPADERRYESERCPVWIAHVSSLFPETLYGIPSHDSSGFKDRVSRRAGLQPPVRDQPGARYGQCRSGARLHAGAHPRYRRRAPAREPHLPLHADARRALHRRRASRIRACCNRRRLQRARLQVQHHHRQNAQRHCTGRQHAA